MNLAILMLQCLQSSFSSILLMVWEEMSFAFFWEEMLFEEFQDGRHRGHLGDRNRTILAILNLQSLPSFRLNLTFLLLEMSFEEYQNGSHGIHFGY